MKAIAKNQTESIISLYINPTKRVEVPASDFDGYITGQVDLLKELTRDQLAKADDIMFHVKERNIVINDGEKDLSWLDAFDYIRNYRFKVDVQGPTTKDGTLITATVKTDFDEVRIVSNNFADKTTWYPDSVRQTGVQLTAASDDNRVWGSKHRFWIDLTHGKFPQEDKIDDVSYYYANIYVYNGDGELIDGYAEKDFDTKKGEYEIDYRSGIVTFNSAIGNDGYVLADYSYATKSTSYLIPKAGKELQLYRAEIQFTTDVEITDTALFSSYVYASVIEAALGYPSGTLGGNSVKLQAKDPTKYKTAMDYVAEGNGNFAPCPPFGGSEWRGLKHPVITIPFDYTTIIRLKSSQGAEVRVALEDDREFEGTYATVTFYCQSVDEGA